MQSKGQLAAKVIGIILVLLLVAGLVAVIYKFTNGFNEDFKTFYVEYEGKQILAQNSELALEPGKTYRFDVKYTFDTQQSETKDYIVEIVPNAEQDFEYLVDGEHISTPKREICLRRSVSGNRQRTLRSRCGRI